MDWRLINHDHSANASPLRLEAQPLANLGIVGQLDSGGGFVFIEGGEEGVHSLITRGGCLGSRGDGGFLQPIGFFERVHFGFQVGQFSRGDTARRQFGSIGRVLRGQSSLSVAVTGRPACPVRGQTALKR